MSSRKQQQYMLLGVGAVVVGALLYVTVGMLAPKAPVNDPFGSDDGEVDMTIVADRTSGSAPEYTWVVKSQEELDATKKSVERIQTELQEVQSKYQSEVAQVRSEYDEALVQQAQKIAELEARLAQGKTAPSTDDPSGTFTPDYADTGSEFIRRNSQGTTSRTRLTSQGKTTVTQQDQSDAVAPKQSFGTSFQLASLDVDSGDGNTTRNSLKNYIPAGSYAPAVVISGADAATNVKDRENPVPVLMRITGPAVSAARGNRKARVNIRGCTVQGSAIGDLSSERVKVRLLSMTCLARDGSVVETVVSGYMAGKGKAGARGNVVSREGKLVGAAAVAGALEGLAKAAERPVYGTQTDEDVSALAQTALRSSASGGVGQAATTLSEYYIRRAEQYQPVVTLNSGTEVEVVFIEGVSLK